MFCLCLYLLLNHFIRFKDETVSRKKLENALADAHRLLSEKDSCIQDCRITIAQHQNAHIETTKERDNLQSMLTDTQITADNETARRKDLEEQCRKLQDEMDFRLQIHEKVSIVFYIVIVKSSVWTIHTINRIQF